VHVLVPELKTALPKILAGLFIFIAAIVLLFRRHRKNTA
jgi:hypothetical protein